ncbi:bifunctional adenosylcobinamide kinase/adenosylcobinamide-phosphate guanylyltransferase [uncultured Roseibium sp.]|uniref:bifunctional adenosylcobinamide kinase/adenosylcobinamide-phosphate guanylyltransferase n=1 Tax=uncultured Roseibium sp. TaxID=1936171 RepID=UPI0037481A1C
MSDQRAYGTLVLGGARSGKSRFAEDLALRSGLGRIYVATGTAFDGEMEKRIAAHRTQRGAGWRTVEEQTDLAGVLRREGKADAVLLVDCLTLWLNNLMMADRDLAAESARLCDAVSMLAGRCIFVSNEVGMGIVPDNRLSRDFRDAQGRLNQDMAAVCGKVIFVAAGQPFLLKPNQQPEISL